MSEKHAGGRPTKYTSEMPEKIQEYMAQGFSLTEFAAHIGVHKDTVYEWAKVYPEFSDALKLARQSHQAYWENELRGMMRGDKSSPPLVKLYFANCFDWHDKQATEHTGNVKVERIERVILNASDTNPTGN